jgi:ornithine cyclodeaminase
MPDIIILTEAELRRCVDIDVGAIDLVAKAFVTLAEGGVRMPPILRLDIPDHNGEVDVKTAYVPGLDGFAIKVSPGFFDNPLHGLPSVNGLMLLFDSRTGLVRAAMFDNGYLTDVRTAAAGAVAARAMAPDGPLHATVLGAGVQARLQIMALSLVRSLTGITVSARDPAKAEACARDLAKALDIEASALPDPQAAVARGDVVVTTTPATAPILKADWLRPGQHVTAMGSDAEHKNEIDPQVFARADTVVVDRRAQCAAMGELHHAIAAGVVSPDVAVPELGEVLSGQVPGRPSPEAITLADLTGTGIQDTAIALYAARRADDAGFGTLIKT